MDHTHRAHRAIRASLFVLAGLLGAHLGGCASKTSADQSPEGEDTAVDGGASAGGDADTSSPGANSGTATPFQLLPAAVYSGYDGVHEFKAPIAVYGGTKPTLKTSDPSVVSIVPAKLENPDGDVGYYFLLTTKKAGTVTLTAEENGKTSQATLTVGAYTPESWVAGNQRYTTGSGSEAPCTQCHLNGKAIDHSPATMAAATDQQVVTVIRTGVLVAGNPIREVPHRWNVTDDQAKGLVTYLRALPPRGVVPSP